MTPHQERVVAEKAALEENVTKLRGFIEGTLFPSLPHAERILLETQLDHMGNYLLILKARILLWTGP